MTAFSLDCILWEGHVNTKGYGNSHGKMVHRRSYEREYGPVASTHVVHHLCGVKRCVNPEHLVSMPRGAHTTMHKKGRRATTCGVCHAPRRQTAKGDWYCRSCSTRRQRERRRARETSR